MRIWHIWTGTGLFFLLGLLLLKVEKSLGNAETKMKSFYGDKSHNNKEVTEHLARLRESLRLIRSAPSRRARFSVWGGKRSGVFGLVQPQRWEYLHLLCAYILNQRGISSYNARGCKTEPKRAQQFHPWGGKRSQDLSYRMSTPSEERLTNTPIDYEAEKSSNLPPIQTTGNWNSYDDAPETEPHTSSNPAMKYINKKSFNSWGGKRNNDNKRARFNAWAGKRSVVSTDKDQNLTFFYDPHQIKDISNSSPSTLLYVRPVRSAPVHDNRIDVEESSAETANEKYIGWRNQNERGSPYVLMANEMGPHNPERRSFSPWAGKRYWYSFQDNFKVDNSDKRPISGTTIKENESKKAFSSWGGKRFEPPADETQSQK